MSGYTYEVACRDREKRISIDRVKKVLGCGTFPLDHAPDSVEDIQCPRCRAVWPDASLVTHHPSYSNHPNVIDHDPGEAAVAPRAVAPRLAAPLAKRSKEDQGRLF